MLRPEPPDELKRWLAYFDRYWDEKLASLKNFVESDQDGRTRGAAPVKIK
ncbi:MAG TPA: hypothetical protein VIL22_08340 [Paenibacillaceae bacterium]